MNLKKDFIKVLAKRAQLSRNLAQFNLKIYLGRQLRMLHKKLCPAWFLHKVDKVYWRKLKNIVKLIILRQLVEVTQRMVQEVTMIWGSHRLISLLELVDKWWPVITTLGIMLWPWIQVKVAIILVLNKDWRVQPWTKEYKEA